MFPIACYRFICFTNLIISYICIICFNLFYWWLMITNKWIRILFCCCCCLPTPLTLVSAIPLEVHQPPSPSIWPEVPSPRRGLSTNPEVTTWCVCWCSWSDDVCCVGGVLQRGHSGYGCDLTLMWFIGSELGKAAKSEAEVSLQRC